MSNAELINKVSVPVQGQTINFYANRKYRYIQRELKMIISLLNRIFGPEFTHAVGRHGELMFDAALGRNGFRAKVESLIGRASTQERMALSVLATSETIMSPRNLEKRYSKIKSAAEVLKRLTEKGLVERVERGQYRVSDPLFAEYVKRRKTS